MFHFLFLFVVFLVYVEAVYDPASNNDWTKLKPSSRNPLGSLDTLPFSFGIVVNPYEKTKDGEFKPPTVPPMRQTVTLTTTTILKSKPTVSADMHQIKDGQVQRVAGKFIKRDDVDSLATSSDSESGSDSDDDNVEPPRRGIVRINHPEDLPRASPAKRGVDITQDFNSPVRAVSCATNTTLQLTLRGGILRDNQNRIGCIVSNHQFQFDGPLPQYGTIYASGWLVTRTGVLALGRSDVFYQCSTGESYNIYNTQLSNQCQPVQLDAVEIIDCLNK